jgi:aminopeptidase YwaD
LRGSEFFVQNPLFPLKNIRFLTNLDLTGTGEEGITTVNASVFKQEFGLLSEINKHKNYFIKIKSRGKAANSDHYWFTERGVPSFFIYAMGGIQAYHDVFDRAETLPLTEFADLFHLIVDFNQAISHR